MVDIPSSNLTWLLKIAIYTVFFSKGGDFLLLCKRVPEGKRGGKHIANIRLSLEKNKMPVFESNFEIWDHTSRVWWKTWWLNPQQMAGTRLEVETMLGFSKTHDQIGLTLQNEDWNHKKPCDLFFFKAAIDSTNESNGFIGFSLSASELQVEVNVSACNAAITGCEKSRLWRKALQLFVQIYQMKLQPKPGFELVTEVLMNFPKGMAMFTRFPSGNWT